MSFLMGTQPLESQSPVKNEPEQDDFLEDDDVHTPVAYRMRSDVDDAEEEEEVERISRKNAAKFHASPPKLARKGMKRPFPDRYYAREPFDFDEGSVAPEEQPDLEAYFSQWHIAPKEVVLICRSYASYVAAAQKSTKK